MRRAAITALLLAGIPQAWGQEIPDTSDLGRIGPRPAPEPEPEPEPEPDAAIPLAIPEAPEVSAPELHEPPAPEAPDPLASILGPHGADRPTRPRRDKAWDARGHLRARIDGTTDPALDPQGTTSGSTLWGSSRAVVGADWKPNDVTHVELELEALNGRFAGEMTEVGTAYSDDVFARRRADTRDLGRILPRKLSATFTAPRVGRFSVGAQLFSWGTGMLANDGAGDPDFGDPDTGDVVARVSYRAAPWHQRDDAPSGLRGLSFFLAGDLVLRDDRASLFDGDLAASGMVGFRLTHPRVDVGAFGMARWQQDRQDPLRPDDAPTQTLVFPVDVHARALLTRPEAPHRLILEGEVAVIAGSTDRPYTDEALVDGASVLGLGTVVRLRYDHDPSRFTARIEVGYASGDDDRQDATVQGFAFHTDHNVGLVLFDQVLPLLTARALDQAATADPAPASTSGGRFTVNQGAVSNAVYLNPVLRWRPIAGLDLRAGYVAAWTAADFVDVYQSALNGGAPTTPGGIQPGTRDLGHEVDLAIRYLIGLPRALSLELGVEGGVLLPGSAFDGIAGSRLDTQWLGRGRVDFRW